MQIYVNEHNAYVEKNQISSEGSNENIWEIILKVLYVVLHCRLHVCCLKNEALKTSLVTEFYPLSSSPLQCKVLQPNWSFGILSFYRRNQEHWISMNSLTMLVFWQLSQFTICSFVSNSVYNYTCWKCYFLITKYRQISNSENVLSCDRTDNIKYVRNNLSKIAYQQDGFLWGSIQKDKGSCTFKYSVVVLYLYWWEYTKELTLKHAIYTVLESRI